MTSSRVPLSVLDLAPIVEGSDAGQALRNSLDLARHAERWGYRRFWLAEHHNMPGIASAATAVAIAHVAAGTSVIRVGAGGIMLPNHAPPEPGQRVRAFPGAGADIEVWILGSSLFGAELAGAFGLPFAFASHFAPALLMQAVDVYRRCFRPSARLARPHVMLGVHVVAAETGEEARLLLTSVQQAFVNLRTGTPTPLPPPVAGYAERLAPQHAAILDGVLAAAAVGTPEIVSGQLRGLVERTGANELIVTSQIYDHAARLRSFDLVQSVWSSGPTQK